MPLKAGFMAFDRGRVWRAVRSVFTVE